MSSYSRSKPVPPIQRREFLKAASVMAAGASAGSAVPAAAMGATPQGKCPEVRTPMSQVAEKVAFITGGSSGIGLGIARAFAEADMKVVIGYRTAKHLEEGMTFLNGTKHRVHAINADVTDRGAMERAAAEVVRMFGKIHVLVSNAGVTGIAPLSRTSYDDWDWVMSVNLDGVFNSMRAFLPYIQNHMEGGQVIATASALGLVADASQASYTASKFAVVGMMECLRAELADTNIGVSVYCPGWVRSNIAQAHRNRPSNLTVSGFEQRRHESTRRVPANGAVPMDPLQAGRLVLDGMRNNDLYILTHPDFSASIQHRSDALVASFPENSSHNGNSTTGSSSKDIYTVERDRKLCKQRTSGR
jgi:NAD(P)-dependent dehydrogenase (short-subunit alcohol dehydrogenase family)